jgi:uncharacterized protein YbbC (DUF1343 family)
MIEPMLRTFAGLALALALLGAGAAWPAPCRPRPIPTGSPSELGVDPGLAGDLDALIADAVRSKLAESVTLLVVRRGHLLYRGSAGGARPGTLFDLASLTKVLATAPSVLKLVEQGKLRLEDPVSKHLPLFRGGDKRAITVLELLTHSSGLHSVVPRGTKRDGRDAILERIRRSALRFAPGTAYRYSDLGFISLGELVRAVSGEPLDRFLERELLHPLGICELRFNPVAGAIARFREERPTPVNEAARRIANPWPAGEREKLGVVYDPLAARLDGVAGNAGLFSTADDLGRFALMMLGEGRWAGTRVLAASTVARMLAPRALPGRPETERRGLGWDLSSPFAGSRGALSPRAYGHTGFTGTSLWIDPAHELAIVLLANRTYYEDARGHAPSVSVLRRRIHDAILSALERRPATAVETGLDRLHATRYAALAGRRVGLITNRTAVDRRGRWIVDLLLGAEARAARVELVALFMPEHGLEGLVDRRLKDAALVRQGRRLPVYSLFGSRRRPTPETLAGIDTLVIDLATVGVRYYTYLSTMGWAMEEAARQKLRFVVLDRPNPLGGVAVQGPLSSAERRTSTNYHPLPVRYGLTLGELARLFARERRLGIEPGVVAARGWRRELLQPETGLPWVNPSPNIRSFRQALLYAGIGLLESTNLAVGRGTDSPFQLVGAPFVDGVALAARLNRLGLAGVVFAPVRFTPRENPHRGQTCGGVRVVLTDARALDAPALGAAVAIELRRAYPDAWETRHLFRLVSHAPTTEAILAGKELPAVRALWTAGLAAFQKLRRRYLLY